MAETTVPFKDTKNAKVESTGSFGSGSPGNSYPSGKAHKQVQVDSVLALASFDKSSGSDKNKVRSTGDFDLDGMASSCRVQQEGFAGVSMEKYAGVPFRWSKPARPAPLHRLSRLALGVTFLLQGNE